RPRPALHALRHHGGRGREDRAARALEADVLDDVALEGEGDGGPVSAERVVALGLVLCGGKLPEVPRLAAVVQDRLLAPRAPLRDHTKTSRTLCRAPPTRSLPWRLSETAG